MEFDYSGILVGTGNVAVLEHGMGELTKRFDMTWTCSYRRVSNLILCFCFVFVF